MAPPAAAKPGNSPTNKAFEPLSVRRTVDRCNFSDALTNTIWHWRASAGSVVRTIRTGWFDTCFPSSVWSSVPPNGSSPSTQIENGELFSAKLLSGHSTNFPKLKRNAAFTWYSLGPCRPRTAGAPKDIARASNVLSPSIWHKERTVSFCRPFCRRSPCCRVFVRCFKVPRLPVVTNLCPQAQDTGSKSKAKAWSSPFMQGSRFVWVTEGGQTALTRPIPQDVPA